MTPFDRAWRGARSDIRLYALSVFSVAVAFVCLAAAVLVVVNVHGVRARWADSGRASVFLKASADGAQIDALEGALRKTPGVALVRRVTSDQARRELSGGSTNPVFDSLPADVFPASLELELTPGLAPTRLEKLKTELSALPSVDTVQTYEAWSDRLGALLSGGVTASLLLAAVVLGAVVSVVSSTIRLSLQRRRIEVEVLKLVGATDAYVRRPFVVEGAAQGGIGAGLAVLLLGTLFLTVRSQVDPSLFTLLGIEPVFLPLPLSFGLVVLGSLLGACSALFSLRKLLVV
ncbi:MAG: permease-like cell division protein FtsX [Polyangiaceae bacterium]